MNFNNFFQIFLKSCKISTVFSGSGKWRGQKFWIFHLFHADVELVGQTTVWKYSILMEILDLKKLRIPNHKQQERQSELFTFKLNER